MQGWILWNIDVKVNHIEAGEAEIGGRTAVIYMIQGPRN